MFYILATDYKNMEYFTKVQKLNWRQARWAFYLSKFDFTLKYISGTKIEKANRLSRRLDWKIETVNNNKSKKVVRVVERIKKAGIKTLKEDKWKIDSKVVLKKEKIYIPKNNI